MKKQLIGFTLFLFFCVLVPLGMAGPAPYTISYSGPSHIPPGGTGTFTFTIKKDGVPQSGVTVYILCRVGYMGGYKDVLNCLSNETPVTDANGQVQTTLTVESGASGTYRIDASAPDREGGKEFDEDIDFVRFNVTIGNSPPPSSRTTSTGPSSPIETTLVRGSGDDQVGLPGKPLANPFVVQVLDEDGDPFEGATVKFSVLVGGGSLSVRTPTTDADGQAKSILTLGTALGTNKVQVNVAGISQVLVFSAEATTTQSVPTTVSIISGDNQGGATGETLTDPFIVEVRYGNDLPLAGLTVTFTVLTGGGTLSATTGTTDANGRAESTLTLGSAPGANTVEVSTENSAEPVTFNAEAVLPPPTPTILQTVSDSNQDDPIVDTLTAPSVVQIHDQNGAPLEDVGVTFTTVGDDGSTTTTSVMTDKDGRAAFTLPSGTDPGRYTITASVEGIADAVTFTIAVPFEFELSLPAGLSLIHVPLKATAVDGVAKTIESIADLYDALGGADAVNFLSTYDPATQDWFSYLGVSDKGTSADRGLTDDIGILVSMKALVSIRLDGDALGTNRSSSIILNQGLNLIGLPLKDPRITRVSDLFALEGITDNVSAIIVSDNGELKLVGRAGDPGDIEITGGQSFILTAQQARTVTISGDAWDNVSDGTMAAPPMIMRGIQPIRITPVLVLSGSIADGTRGVHSAGFRVSVKNLSTGSVVTTGVEGVDNTSSEIGYRLTVVDIENGQAAAMGDILEISVTSPDTSIGVEPLRYTVTAEDVRRSRVELPALFLQEVPTETELLRNYPNPFNPETWIPYRLAEDAFVALTIYDGSGGIVQTLGIGHQTAAVYESRSRAAYWDGRNNLGESVASGVYFYTLTAGDYSATRKMLILK